MTRTDKWAVIEQRRKRAVQLRRDGHTVGEIAEALGIRERQVFAYFAWSGAGPVDPRKRDRSAA